MNISKTELKVLKLVAQAYTNEEIGEILSVSKKTIDCHRHNMIKRLKLRNSIDLVMYGLRMGLIPIIENSHYEEEDRFFVVFFGGGGKGYTCFNYSRGFPPGLWIKERIKMMFPEVIDAKITGIQELSKRDYIQFTFGLNFIEHEQN